MSLRGKWTIANRKDRMGEIRRVASVLMFLEFGMGDHEQLWYVVSEFCGFTPDEDARARDALFDDPDTGLIGDWMRSALAVCSTALNDELCGFMYDGDESNVWAALYNLFEIDSLHDTAVEHGYKGKDDE